VGECADEVRAEPAARRLLQRVVGQFVEFDLELTPLVYGKSFLPRPWNWPWRFDVPPPLQRAPPSLCLHSRPFWMVLRHCAATTPRTFQLRSTWSSGRARHTRVLTCS